MHPVASLKSFAHRQELLGAIGTQLALDVGFGLADRIIWNKTPMKGFHFGSLPYPPSPLICDSMEYIFIFRKPGRPDYSYLAPELKERSRLAPDEYKEFTKQIWTLAAWLLYALLLHQRLALGWKGRRVALFSLLTFLVLLAGFILEKAFFNTLHNFM